MDFKIVKKEEFEVVGICENINAKDGQNFEQVPKMWQNLMKSGNFNKLHSKQKDLGMLGICMNYNEDRLEFDYMIAVEGTKLEDMDNIQTVKIPSATWAVFESVGPIPDSIQNTWQYIFKEWLPNSPYKHANAPEFESYFDGDPQSKDYKSYIWIPIKKREY
ncbi:MAG: GyrI-like domain-containing protein [Peptostreptococcaceae bacterium]|nr:GyrI-like domain-containing protein [Peptostreptococcaceae bacterium]